MRKNACSALAIAALLLLVLSARPQNPTLAPVENRRKALNALFEQYWDARLEVEPEFASTIGDKRWNDNITD